LCLAFASVQVFMACQPKSPVKEKQMTAQDSILALVQDTASQGLPEEKEIVYHEKYDSSLSEKGNLYEGWIKTFKLDGNSFRLRYDSSMLVEKLVKNAWVKNAEFDIHDQFEMDWDYNNDGYYDIYSQAQGWNYVNFYNPSTKKFSKQFQLPGDGDLMIDAARKLYINFREPYHGCNNYVSQLFNYSNSEPNILYTLEGETPCNADTILIMKLYRYNQKNDSLILLRSFKPRNIRKFGYVDFWKKNYNKLVP
jgi:hypothetical protein